MENYSVLMSLYYKEKPEFLRCSLDSIINQTVKPDEIVIVEDGRLTDELYEVLDEYSCLIKRIKNEVNMGLGISLGIGLKHCKNEIVARMDTDDIAVSDRCEKQLNFLADNADVSIVGGQITEFYCSEDNIIGSRVVPCDNRDVYRYMKKRCPFNHMTVMFRKSDIVSVGGYKDWFWNEDYYLWIRMACAGYKFANLSDVLVNVRSGLELYSRRGGKKYFLSELNIQKLMLKIGMINYTRYSINVIERFIVQVLLPNKVRGLVFRLFARKRV